MPYYFNAILLEACDFLLVKFKTIFSFLCFIFTVIFLVFLLLIIFFFLFVFTFFVVLSFSPLALSPRSQLGSLITLSYGRER